MAATAAGIKATLKAIFNLDADTITIRDNYDYLANGVDPSSVAIKGCFTSIRSPLGLLLYSNTNFASPDTDISASDFEKSIPFPLDSNGKELQGKYIITYKVQFDGAGDIEIEVEREYCLTTPNVCVNQSYDCVNSKFTSQDDTITTVGGWTPTIVREHTVKYPGAITPPKADVVSSQKKIVVNPIYTGTWVSRVELVLTYDSVTVSIIVTIEGASEKTVVCDLRLCDLYCCIVSVFKRWRNVLGQSESQRKGVEQMMWSVMSLASLYRHAQECGKTNDAAIIYDTILKLTECKEGCGCGDAPQLVVPLGGGSSSEIVVQSGSGITVDSVTVGGVTTYTVNLDAATIAILASALAITITTDTPDEIQIIDDGNGNFKVNWVGFDLSMMDLWIPLRSSDAVVDLTKARQVIWGSRYDFNSSTPKPLVSKVGTGNDSAIFKVENFLLDDSADALVDKVFIQLNQVTIDFTPTAVNIPPITFADLVALVQAGILEVRLMKVAHDEFYFGIYDNTTGALIAHNVFDDYTLVYWFHVQITH